MKKGARISELKPNLVGSRNWCGGGLRILADCSPWRIRPLSLEVPLSSTVWMSFKCCRWRSRTVPPSNSFHPHPTCFSSSFFLINWSNESCFFGRSSNPPSFLPIYLFGGARVIVWLKFALLMHSDRKRDFIDIGLISHKLCDSVRDHGAYVESLLRKSKVRYI
jgi:hypothetical protein